MSNWRPEGWTVATGMRLYKGKLLSNTREAFEAGADTMLKAISEEIEKVAILTIDEWLDSHGIDRAYKKDMKPTYKHIKEDLEAQLQKILALLHSK